MVGLLMVRLPLKIVKWRTADGEKDADRCSDKKIRVFLLIRGFTPTLPLQRIDRMVQWLQCSVQL